MASEYLIDTNVIIDFAAERLPESAIEFITNVINSSPSISIINKIELLGFSDVPEAIVEFVNSTTVYPLDEDVANLVIQLRRNHKIKLPDAIIAATVLVHDLILLSRNTHDFKSISILQVKNPYHF